MKPDAVRGHLDALVLAVVEESPQHGYAIMEALQRRSGGALDLPTERSQRRDFSAVIEGVLRPDPA